MRFLKRQSQFVFISFCLLTSCRGRQPMADSCPNNILLPEGKADHEQIGGFVSVSYFPEVTEHSHWVEEQYVNGKGLDIDSEEGKYLKQFIARQKKGILNSQHCSTFLDFSPNKSEASTNLSYEVNFWTSKHCLAYPFIDKLEFFISTPQGFIKADATEHPFSTSAALQPYLGLDSVFFSHLFLYRSGDMHRASTAINLMQKRGNFLATDGLDEGTAYSRNLCNSFRRDGVQVKPFSMDKACFNFLDLAVFKAKLDLSTLDEAQRNTLLPMIAQQIEAKNIFYNRNPEIRDALHDWHRLVKLQWINGYKVNLDRARQYVKGGCQKISDEPRLSAEDKPTFCSHEPAMLALEQEWQSMQALADELSTKENLNQRNPRASLNQRFTAFNEVNITQTLPGWQKLGQLLAGYDQLYLHWNYFNSEQKQSHYNSLSMDELLEFTFIPPIWHDGGLAMLAKTNTLPWVQGDSGAIVSYAGMIPILSLSSMNDEETTGGRATVSLPMFQPSESVAFRDDAKPEQNNEKIVRSQDGNGETATVNEPNTPYDENLEKRSEARSSKKCS